MENPGNDEEIGNGIDRINAHYFDEAGNRASGLCLEAIGLDGHAIANQLWKISAYLRKRAEARRDIVDAYQFTDGEEALL